MALRRDCMRSTVERLSLVREIHLAFNGWTVQAMTTAEQPIAVAAASSVVGLRRSAGATDWRRQLGLVAGVTAALLGSQTLAASTPLRSDVRLLLPSEGLLAGLGDGLRR